MRRPPDRKLVLAATLLLVAASLVVSRPAVGTGHALPAAVVVKLFGRS